MRNTIDLRILQEFQLSGGATDSLFPEVEAQLLADEEAQAALRFVTQSKEVRRYQSLMDFLFCETFREHRGRCLKYYEGEAPPLRQTLTKLPEWRYYNRVMLGALGFAKVAYRRGDKVAWSRFVGILKRAVKEAGN